MSKSKERKVSVSLESLKDLTAQKVFRNHQLDTPITSINFDHSGQLLLTSGVDETLQLYEVPKGRHLKSIYSKKYGCDLAMFTNTSHSKCLFASTKENHIIRLLNLEDNSFIRYFKGHSSQVINLKSSTSSTRIDSFYSSALDGTVKSWDMRTNSYTASLSLEAPPLIALDPSNTVMAICSGTTLQLVSMEKFPTGLINSADLSPCFDSQDSLSQPKAIQFSNDNKHIIVTTTGTRHLVLDAFSLECQGYLYGQVPLVDRNYPDTGNLTVTPDGTFVLGGSGDGELLVWDISSLTTNASKQPLDPAVSIRNESVRSMVPRMVLFNPIYEMLATADTEVIMWTRP